MFVLGTSSRITTIMFVQVDAASVKGSSTELPELARAAACSLQQAVTREKTWAIRLEKLIGTSDFRSGLQNIANCQQVGKKMAFHVYFCHLSGCVSRQLKTLYIA